MELRDEELANISGGALKLSIALIIGGAATILVGIIDGYLRPLKCRK